MIGEIGDLVFGKIIGRRTEDEVTVYKSLGFVAQDLIAAHAVCTSRKHSDARARPLGKEEVGARD